MVYWGVFGYKINLHTFFSKSQKSNYLRCPKNPRSPPPPPPVFPPSNFPAI
ncbi:Protein CBG26087 [Caenorhabditis briggsae]|uniref:Protein CBG26087 n=1 Tax=Caenorhabditis briggsae TaxID=6238 RepID=B6IJJ7_CAEBR|nr:Protein CBG26087 [Caenorhabditis briggsae]CAS00077.1 Protein CBG26087 [Caenorhabditis briggsae]